MRSPPTRLRWRRWPACSSGRARTPTPATRPRPACARDSTPTSALTPASSASRVAGRERPSSSAISIAVRPIGDECWRSQVVDIAVLRNPTPPNGSSPLHETRARERRLPCNMPNHAGLRRPTGPPQSTWAKDGGNPLVAAGLSSEPGGFDEADVTLAAAVQARRRGHPCRNRCDFATRCVWRHRRRHNSEKPSPPRADDRPRQVGAAPNFRP